MENTKVICRCKNVFFEDIEAAIKEGASTFEEVQEKTKISTGCGRCLKQAQEVTDFLLSKNK